MSQKYVDTDNKLHFMNPTDSKLGILSPSRELAFTIFGVKWPTFEHYIQACKFVGRRTFVRIAKAKTPLEALKIGGNPRFSPNVDWLEKRDEFLYQGLVTCLSQNPEIGRALIATGDAELVYTSHHDTWLGIGRDGKGENRLGEIYTEIRSQIKAAAKEQFENNTLAQQARAIYETPAELSEIAEPQWGSSADLDDYDFMTNLAKPITF